MINSAFGGIFKDGACDVTYRPLQGTLLVNVAESPVDNSASGLAELGAGGHEPSIHGIGDLGRA